MSPEAEQHVPGQEEILPISSDNPPTPAPKLEEIPAEGNNIGDVQNRAFADTPDPNLQPPVEKTFVSPKD